MAGWVAAGFYDRSERALSSVCRAFRPRQRSKGQEC